MTFNPKTSLTEAFAANANEVTAPSLFMPKESDITATDLGICTSKVALV